MKGYVFTFGQEDYEVDSVEIPAFGAGVYTDKEKAFKHLMKINKNGYKNWQEISRSKKNT